MRPHFISCAATLVLIAVACDLSMGIPPEPAPARIADGIYVLRGSGGDITRENGGRVANITFIVGPRGVVVAGTGISYREGEDIIAAVRTISPLPIRLAVLTHPDQEVIFGAAAFKAHGIPLLMHRHAADLMASRCELCLRNLRALLGEETMSLTQLVSPDRIIDASQTIDVIGRPLRVIATSWSSAPGAVALFDGATSTLIAGNLVLNARIPDLRDADVPGWRHTLAELAAMKCRHLVGAYGPPGSCADIAQFARYLSDLEQRVAALMRDGVSLAELHDRCDLPAYAAWDQYGSLHAANANRTYLRLERKLFE